jgi:hypothetical protein
MKNWIDSKKKKYSPPSATKLTHEQAIKLAMDRMKCTEQGARDFLDSLKEQKQDAA